MLSQMTVSHFKTFGFVVLRGLLSDTEVAQLRDEVSFAMTDAYGERYSDDNIEVAAEPAYDIPMMNADTPLATRLVADDPRLWQASHYLMGGPTVPTNGEATSFRANAKWHADMTSDVAGVKFMAYLEPCSPSAGQLQVLPGSHVASAQSDFWDYIGQDPRRQGHVDDRDDWPVPAFGINTLPGDVIAFHSNLLHSSVGGNRRTAWDVYYFSDPILHGQEKCETIRDAILHIGDYNNHSFDHDKWPAWRNWISSSTGTGAREAAINRLRRLGVLSTDGADMGMPKWQPRLAKPSSLWVSGAPATRRSNQ